MNRLSLTARRAASAVLLALSACAAAPAERAAPAPGAEQPEVSTVLGAMRAEMGRSMRSLTFKDYDAPYFIAYQIKDITTRGVSGKFGSVTDRTTDRARLVYTEVRVGDYGFDNFANIDNEAYRLSEYAADKSAPLDANRIALRGVLWQLTDEAYKKALSDYLTKRGGAVYATEEKTEVPSFSRAEPVTYRAPIADPSFDDQAWSGIVERVTSRIRRAEGLIDASMSADMTHTARYLTTSEGTSLVDDAVIYSIQIDAVARADDGMSLDNGRSFYARSAAELPDEATLNAEVDQMIEELNALRAAPVIDPYTGPAILMPEASGVLFHEAVGHRLEGERQRDDEEGRTFQGRLGKRVIPKFLSVYDDPTLKQWEGTELNGFYLHDDEGVEAERATLIERGVLRDYLTSRTPIEGALSSNGHGRAQGVAKPMARMANLVVAASPERSVPYDELKRMLLEEIRKQKKPFGLIIRDITGGSTNTSGYGYQAFKGASRLIYKVDPKSGAETLVRGAEIVGTPLVSINKIVAASQESGVFNGYCGAESGYVPVSTVAPALLTTELELQRTQSSRERPPLLAPPWTEEPEGSSEP